MQQVIPRNWRPHDLVISFVVLALLLAFTYGLLFRAPYQGFYFNPSNGEVVEIYQPESSNPGLEVGDLIERVGTVSFEDFRERKTSSFFHNVQPGKTVDIVVRSDGQTITVPWIYPGINRPEFQARFFNVWWLAYIFWFIGTSTQLFMRPKDRRWRLFLTFNYLTALFIMFGGVSSFRIYGSSILLRAVAWLMLPVYLHFHWIFPQSLRPVPRWLQVVFYLICCLMGLAELFLPTPRTLYFLAVILAFGGSILLLICHYLFQPEHRREVRVLAIAAFFSLGFTIVTSIIGSSGQTPHLAVFSLLGLPILPGTYFYILYRRSLSGLELRANRAISMYFFIILLAILLVLTFGFLDLTREEIVIAAILIALLSAFASLLIFPAFQSFVERRILGIKLPAQSLSENYSARIITSDTLSDLLKLLREEVFPSLLIRQYAFVRNLKTSVQVLLSENVTQAQVREEALLDLFASSSIGNLIPLSKPGPPLEWVQLMLPLRFGSELIGVWLFGRRDPDDRYPQAEIPILQSLANQTAVALSNILQTEQIRSIYEANILRHEQERTGLARDLHDSVLNELAALLMSRDAPILSPKFQEAYAEVSQRLREIVSDLRPPMLNFGLKLALDGLADSLMERNQGSTQIVADITANGECRYAETVEINLYRIVQEACQNSVRYAQAKNIRISGSLSPDTIDIAVSDDGVGFIMETNLRMHEMSAKKHFGLLNMLERANLIGSAIKIDSKPGKGTSVHVQWESK